MIAAKPNGLLLIDKPKGISSNQALQKVKRLLAVNKAGHTGTLDPMATGMLPICLGEATKLSQYLLADSKIYEFTMQLGVRTETGDAEGEVVNVEHVPELTEAQINTVLEEFIGAISQVPPMYSALKHEGKPLYQYARAGQQVHRDPREVVIQLLDFTHYDPEHAQLTLRTHCSSGTYIRVLAQDIAAKLGTVSHLIMLRRIAVGSFPASAMLTLEALEQARSHGETEPITGAFWPLDEIPLALNSIHLTADIATRLCHGQRVQVQHIPSMIGSESETDYFHEGLRFQLVNDNGLFGIGIMTLSDQGNWLLKLDRQIKKYD